jgi:hypothetical protein
MTIGIILDQIERLGWILSFHRVNGTIEMHAIMRDGSADPQSARCNDGDDEECEYRCACLLAEAKKPRTRVSDMRTPYDTLPIFLTL